MPKTIHLTEKQLKCCIEQVLRESVSEMNLYHGTQADFNQFDLAYLSTGWGQQAHGYGVYLTTDYDCAKEYSMGPVPCTGHKIHQHHA